MNDKRASSEAAGGKHLIWLGVGLLLGALFGGPRLLGAVLVAAAVVIIIAAIAYQIGVEDRTIWKR